MRRGVEYASGICTILPERSPAPRVAIVLGYPDVGVITPLGCQFREMGMAVSWGQLFPATGMVGIVYETRDPARGLTGRGSARGPVPEMCRWRYRL
ncbi:MAG: hypothetical protein ABSF98_09635 [Bryobacteraceae bacterium]